MFSRIAIVTAAAVALAIGQPKAAPEKKDERTGVNRAPDPPKGSIEIKPGVWEYRDETGKVWWYRRTPFGLAKLPPGNNENAESDKRESAYLKAEEDGDSVKFERKTPFGVSRWTRKKSELKGAELQAWKRVEAAKTSAQK